MDEFAVFNEVYQHYFKGDAPARSGVAVDRRPQDVLVEVEAMAVV